MSVKIAGLMTLIIDIWGIYRRMPSLTEQL